jgi:hypothetical protein
MPYRKGQEIRFRTRSKGYRDLNIMPNLTSGAPAHPNAGHDGQAGDPLDRAVAAAARHLLQRQRPDGHWVFELEADATIPSEYLMLHHFFGHVQPEKEARIGRYLRRIQAEQRANAGGGWPLFHGGPLDISCSVKAYLALRLIGDAPDAPHMIEARDAILAAGGAERSNVFTGRRSRCSARCPGAPCR